MNWTSAFQLGTAIIASLGGGAAIVFGLSSYLGKLWADRAIQKEKHKYDAILQTAKNELDKATNRYQVELDSLTLIHKLRTTEEFSRLGQLWKHMAILQDAFKATAARGLSIVPADKDEARKYRLKLRVEYENAIADTRTFFLQEKLFIPKEIAAVAEMTLGQAIKEKNHYDIFANHEDSQISRHYRENLEHFCDNFDNGISDLEEKMRNYIEGVKLSLLTRDV